MLFRYTYFVFVLKILVASLKVPFYIITARVRKRGVACFNFEPSFVIGKGNENKRNVTFVILLNEEFMQTTHISKLLFTIEYSKRAATALPTSGIVG